MEAHFLLEKFSNNIFVFLFIFGYIFLGPHSTWMLLATISSLETTLSNSKIMQHSNYLN